MRRMRIARGTRRVTVGALAGALLCAASGSADPARRPTTYEERNGSFFAPAPPAPATAAPPTKVLPLPSFAEGRPALRLGEP
jgi:hypothetical protein